MALRMLAFTIFATVIHAHADPHTPTIYGKVAKELQYVSQDKDVDADSYVRSLDTDNSETRFGIKGTYELEDLSVSYKLEVGFNSSYEPASSSPPATNGATSGRIRIRHSSLAFDTELGTLWVGQTFTPTAAISTGTLDPLANTSAGQHALIHDSMFTTVRSAKGGIGTYYRSRKDGFGFNTKKYGPFSAKVWTDRNDEQLIESGNASEEFNEALFQFDFDKMTVYLGAIYWGDSTTQTENNSNYILAYAGRYGSSEASLSYSLGRSTKNQGTVATNDDFDQVTQRFFFAYSFMNGKNKYSFTYARRLFDGGDDTLKTDDYSLSQISLGVKRNLSESISVHAVVFQFKSVEEDSALAVTQDFTGAAGAVGATVTF